MNITIITVVYNNVLGIEATINSVLNQTYKNIDYIIIDGGSTDGTVEKIKKYVDRISLFISEKDTGIYNAMNKGLVYAKGKWVLFLNSGDWLYAVDTISTVCCHIDESIDVFYGDQCFDYGDKKIIKCSDSSLCNFSKYMPLFHPATLVKRELLKEHPFDEKYKIAADYKQLYSLYLEGYSFKKINIVISNFEAVSGVSNINYSQAMKENFKVRSKENFFIWYPKYICLMIYIYIKHFFSN